MDQTVRIRLQCGRPGFNPWVGKTPLESSWSGNSLQYSCLENPHGQRSLAGYSPWSCKELDMTEQLNTAPEAQGECFCGPHLEELLCSCLFGSSQPIQRGPQRVARVLDLKSTMRFEICQVSGSQHLSILLRNMGSKACPGGCWESKMRLQ